MKKYLAVFYGSADAIKKWDAMPESERKDREKKGILAWHSWGEKNGKSITVMGSPLGKTKSVNQKGVIDSKNELTAYTEVQAESHEAAAKMFLEHPHFSIFPGDRIEIMECLAIPDKK